MASRPVDYKKFGLRRVLKPFVQGGLSSTVLIEGGGHINVAFSGALVSRAGLLLPRGISPQDTAYMSLRHEMSSGKYLLYVQYLDERRSTEKYLLLVFPERPTWLKLPKTAPHTSKITKDKSHDPHCT